jgi:hypothetical protein
MRVRSTISGLDRLGINTTGLKMVDPIIETFRYLLDSTSVTFVIVRTGPINFSSSGRARLETTVNDVIIGLFGPHCYFSTQNFPAMALGDTVSHIP